MAKNWTPNQAKQHPGYEPGVKQTPDCGCRGPQHWCTRHQLDAARDAGRVRQERQSGRKH